MACFLVPTAEAIITTIVIRSMEKNGHKPEEVKVSFGGQTEKAVKIPFVKKLKWLNGMLWGGSALLAFEHVWHGEVVPWFPFLTAMNDAGDAAEMFHEMATSGVGMAVLVTLIWIGMVLVSSALENKAQAVPAKEGAR